MPDREDSNASRPAPAGNAFDPRFLRRFGRFDEPPAAYEAGLAGPWAVVPHSRGFALLRRWESLERGDRPRAVFAERPTALLAAAALPAVGRDPALTLGQRAGDAGFPLDRGRESAGHLAYFDEGLVDALNLLEALTRSPEALARLLEAAGASALGDAGKALFRAVEAR